MALKSMFTLAINSDSNSETQGTNTTKQMRKMNLEHSKNEGKQTKFTRREVQLKTETLGKTHPKTFFFLKV